MMEPALTANKRRYRPTRLRGCVLWLDAARIPAGAVASTPNLGTLGGTFEQSTSGARPTCTAGAGPRGNALVFDGGDYLASSLAASNWSFLHSQNFTVYLVCKTTSANPNAYYGLLSTATSGTNDRGFAIFYDDRSSLSRNDRLITNINNGGASVCSALTGNNAFPAAAWGLIEVVISYQSSGSDMILAVNGTSVQTSEFSGVPSASAPQGALEIGRLVSDSGSRFVGSIAEVFAFNRTLSTAERSWCRSYVRAKHLLSGS